MTPIYKLSIADEVVHSRLEKLTIEDNAEEKADILTLVLNGIGLAKPETGVIISLEVGYEETDLWDAGQFVVDEVSRVEGTANILKGGGLVKDWVNRIIIIARSVPKGDNDLGYSLQTISEARTWQNKTYGEIASDIVKGVGGKLTIEPRLRDIKMPVVQQRNESDAAFLARLGRERNAFTKISGNEVIIRSYNSSEIGVVSITREMVTGYHYRESQSYNVEKVIVPYTDMELGKTIDLVVGDGSSKLGERVPRTQPDKETARLIGNSILEWYKRHFATVSLRMPVIPGLFAEKVVELSGFDDEELNRRYVVRTVKTKLNTKGFIANLVLESLNPVDS